MKVFDRIELQKNGLDIEYKFESQKAITFLALATISSIGFISYASAQGQFILALSVGTAITVVGAGLYLRTKRKMDGLLSKILNL